MARLPRLAIAALVIVGAAVLMVLAQPQGGLPRFDREPTVTVVDEETGRRDEMPMEQYVMGVVAGEIKPGWPRQAYAAQAILARTFALDFLNRTGGNEIPSTHQVAQAYRPENITDVIRQAVADTRGEVLTYRGNLVRGWFHSYAGGQTATAREGLALDEREPPYILSTELPPNPYAPADVRSWEARIPLTEVTRGLQERGVAVGEVRDVRVDERGPTGRITRLTVIGSRGRQTLSGPDFRLAVGPERMKSAKVSRFEVEDGVLRVAGSGFGHGVGLSQWDAFRMAREGMSPQDIVRAFFRDVEVRKLWE